MERVQLNDASFLSYDRYGSGPPLILVHGGLSDHQSNWAAVKDLFGQRFTVYAVARRGRGETTAPLSRALEEEFQDIATLIDVVGQTSLLGHSGGARIAMGAAVERPELVSKLVLYEPPVVPNMAPVLSNIEGPAARGDWEAFVRVFLLEAVQLPAPIVDAITALPIWPAMVADGPATFADIRALVGCQFDPAHYASLTMPVLLLVGSESPRDNYATDALAAVLPDHRIVELQGQGHIAQAMAPQMFVDTVSSFLFGSANS